MTGRLRSQAFWIAAGFIVVVHGVSAPAPADASSRDYPTDIALPALLGTVTPRNCSIDWRKIEAPVALVRCLRSLPHPPSPPPLHDGRAESASDMATFPVASSDALECAVIPAVQSNRCEKWDSVYDDGGRDELVEMEVSPTGDRVFALGISENEQGWVWTLVGTDAGTGDRTWVVKGALGAHQAGMMVPTDMAVSSDGSRVYLTGIEGLSSPNSDVLMAAYSAATGEKLWKNNFDGAPIGHIEGEPYPLFSADGGLAVTSTREGHGVYVTAYSDSLDGYLDINVVAYDGTTGTRKWVARYDNSSPDSAFSAESPLPALTQLSADGKALYLVGKTCPQSGSGQDCRHLVMSLQAHDPLKPSSDGKWRWVRELNGDGEDPPTSLQLAPDGRRLYLTAVPCDAPQAGECSFSYDAATGNQIWAAKLPFQSSYWEPVWRMVASPRGDKVFVLVSELGIVAYDATSGQRSWDAGGDYLAVAVSPDGDSVYVSGGNYSDAFDPERRAREFVTGGQFTAAYDAVTGGDRWTAYYHPGPLVYADWPIWSSTGPFLGVAPDGTVFTGSQFQRDFLEHEQLSASDWGIQAYEP